MEPDARGWGGGREVERSGPLGGETLLFGALPGRIERCGVQIRRQLAKLRLVTTFQPNRTPGSLGAPGDPTKDVLVTLFCKVRCGQNWCGRVVSGLGVWVKESERGAISV